MHIQDDENPVVCRVTPDGDVICESASKPDVLASDEPAFKTVSEAVIKAVPGGNWGPNKLLLLWNIIQVLDKSALPDTPNIPRRTGEIVNTVRMLLDPTNPPSILLYTYSTQPADVVGAYFLNKAELVRMQRLYDTFKSPKPN